MTLNRERSLGDKARAEKAGEVMDSRQFRAVGTERVELRQCRSATDAMGPGGRM